MEGSSTCPSLSSQTTNQSLPSCYKQAICHFPKLNFSKDVTNRRSAKMYYIIPSSGAGGGNHFPFLSLHFLEYVQGRFSSRHCPASFMPFYRGVQMLTCSRCNSSMFPYKPFCRFLPPSLKRELLHNVLLFAYLWVYKPSNIARISYCDCSGKGTCTGNMRTSWVLSAVLPVSMAHQCVVLQEVFSCAILQSFI